mmetsp:Transcript_99620/g.282160  ORF Transcript_99620/g.282160 Transcript_99620/m.282160 type:complete len:159 (-) Transcript_99620:22-498(-)
MAPGGSRVEALVAAVLQGLGVMSPSGTEAISMELGPILVMPAALPTKSAPATDSTGAGVSTGHFVMVVGVLTVVILGCALAVLLLHRRVPSSVTATPAEPKQTGQGKEGAACAHPADTGTGTEDDVISLRSPSVRGPSGQGPPEPQLDTSEPKATCAL